MQNDNKWLYLQFKMHLTQQIKPKQEEKYKQDNKHHKTGQTNKTLIQFLCIIEWRYPSNDISSERAERSEA